MNDLERDLRELLQRKADEGWAQPEAPVRVLRRIRRRQAGTAVVAGVAAALVGLASFAGVRAVLDPDGEEQPAAPTTTRTLNGITIEYPEGWFLVDPSTVIGGTAAEDMLLALSNRELTAEAMACPGMAEGSSADQVMLTVQGIASGVAEDAWPVSLDPLPIEGGRADSRCFPRWEFLNARWTSSGRSYEGVVGTGPDATPADREAIASAFASMAFVAGPSPDPTAAVIAEGTAAGEAWQLIARRTDGVLELEFRSPSGGSAMTGPFEGDDVPLVVWSPLVLGAGPSAEVLAFGLVSPEVAQVDVTVPGDGHRDPGAEIVDIPDEISPDLQAFWAAVGTVDEVTVRVLDAGGNVLDEQTIDPTEDGSTSVPTAPEQQEGDPPVVPMVPEQGRRHWGAYLWIGTAEEAEQVGFETGEWLRQRGFPFSAGDLVCDRPVAGSIGGPDDDWRIAVYFDYNADANVFVEWYLATRFPGADHVPIPIVEVRTYCLD